MTTQFAWQVEALRFTLFYSSEKDPSVPQDLFQRITGTAPESRMEKRQEKVIVEQGAWEDHQLTVQVQPERVDILFNAIQLVPELANAGEFEAVVPKFGQLVLHDLGFTVTRIAFGATLLHPEKNHVSAYETLSKYLPNLPIDPASKEFVFQINRPRISKCVDGLEINRLNSWSAVSVNFFTLKSEISNPVRLFGAKLTLDINSAQDKAIPDQKLLVPLSKELIEMGVEISQRGDVT
jgi:hypothetical protein